MITSLFTALAVAATASIAAGPAAAQVKSSDGQPTATYVAELHPMNAEVAGSEIKGEARFSIAGDTLTISVEAHGLPAGIMHLQHFHGFKDNRDATCPTPAADANHDGIVDLIETEPLSGTTMVPFHDDPVSMDIVRDTYPKASASGALEYRKSVSLDALRSAFAKAFGDYGLDLDRRVVFVHGVFPNSKLPASAASLGTIPAYVTLPIACGEIRQLPR